MQRWLAAALLFTCYGHAAQATWSGQGLQKLMNDARHLQTKIKNVQSYLATTTTTTATSEPHKKQTRKTRGIVMTFSGSTMLMNAIVISTVIRKNLTCNIPIELIYFNEEAPDPVLAAAAKELKGIEIVDGAALSLPQHHRQAKVVGWPSKAVALYQSRFSQVLMLDIDSQPLIDPVLLFANPIFRERGNMFWPDYFEFGGIDPWNTCAREEAYYLLGVDLPWRDGKPWRSSESGQFLFDRERHRDVLEYVLLINTHSDVIYSHAYGDKDTFQMAFMLAGKEDVFYQNPHRLRMGLSNERVTETEEKAHYHRSLGNFQSDAEGRPIFYHRTMHKFKLTTDAAAKSMLPELITEALVAEVMMHNLHEEHDIQKRHPEEPFDYILALHASGVRVSESCACLSAESKHSELKAAGSDTAAAACSYSTPGSMTASAFPVSCFGAPVWNGLHSAYEAFGRIRDRMTSASNASNATSATVS